MHLTVLAGFLRAGVCTLREFIQLCKELLVQFSWRGRSSDVVFFRQGDDVSAFCFKEVFIRQFRRLIGFLP